MGSLLTCHDRKNIKVIQCPFASTLHSFEGIHGTSNRCCCTARGRLLHPTFEKTVVDIDTEAGAMERPFSIREEEGLEVKHFLKEKSTL